MSGGGSRPGERRGGRKPGTPNKRTVELQRKIDERAEARLPSQPDSLEQLRATAMAMQSLAAREQQKGEEADVRFLSDLLERTNRMWERVAAFEHPKMSAVTVTQTPIDPAKLTDAQLAELEKIIAAASVARSDTDRTGSTRH